MDNRMNGQRLMVAIVVAALVFIVGSKIPLPGLDMSKIAPQLAGGGDGLSRFSIFALGLMPIYTAFSLVEIGRLFTAGRDEGAVGPGFWEKAIVSVIALALTVLQGYGIVAAWQDGGLVDTDLGMFPVLAIGTYMGATALLLFFCFRIALPGFRNSIWALWSIPVLLALMPQLFSAFETTRMGAIPATAWLLAAAYLVLAIGGVVFIAKLWASICMPGGEAIGAVEPRDILIWPPALAGTVTTLMLTGIALIAPDLVNQLGGWLSSVYFSVTALIIPFFVLAYVRRLKPLFRPDAPVASVTASIALVQILLVVVGGIVTGWGNLPISLGFIAIMALTMTALGLRNPAV